MITVQDAAGRSWSITVDVNALKRVMRANLEYMGEPLTKVNLLSLVEPDSDLLKKVVEYPPLVCDIAYVVCQPQCAEKNVSDEDFGRAMSGECLEKMLDGILEETVGFFPPARCAVLKRVLDKSRAFSQKAETLTKARLDEGMVDQAIDAILGPCSRTSKRAG